MIATRMFSEYHETGGGIVRFLGGHILPYDLLSNLHSPIFPRKRLSNKSRHLIHEPIRLARVQDPSETPHLRIRPILELLEPVIHDSTLPGVVDGIRSRDCRVEQPLLLGRPLHRHFDDRVLGIGEIFPESQT
nr:hypothetical protein Iba_chr01cCG6080 [Ipomoea batatas]